MQRRRSSIAWLVTHGEKEDGPDPGMTPQGKERVQSLRSALTERLPDGKPTEVHVGTGRRQSQVVEALGLAGEKLLYSAIWGDGVTEVKRNGKSLIMLPDGQLISWDQYLSPMHLEAAIRRAIMKLPVDTIICSGRPVLVRLGMAINDPRCQSGALYAIHVERYLYLADHLAQIPFDWADWEPGDSDSIEVELVVSGVSLGDGKGAEI